MFIILWQNYSLIASVVEFEEQEFYPSEITSNRFSAMDIDELDLQKSPADSVQAVVDPVLQPILLKKSRINNTQQGKGKQLQYFDLDDQGQPNGRSLIVHQHEYAIDSDARMDSLAEQRGKEIRASFYRYTASPDAKVIRRDGRSYKNALSPEQIKNYKKMRKNDAMILRVQRRLSEIRNQKFSNNYQITELNKLITANEDKKATLLERIAWRSGRNNNEQENRFLESMISDLQLIEADLANVSLKIIDLKKISNDLNIEETLAKNGILIEQLTDAELDSIEAYPEDINHVIQQIKSKTFCFESSCNCVIS